ncbi:MAG: flavodoxin-dependent (E)-4-hydroxy-3-methylbut-2-enyl-diphosphate synthase [Pyrinomonadaceae bacterium]|nr:flavodoxin-dependent (E)-4-hydroxy-3-methylbut-2-enyl-diphosphate synthase [Pyrinomonadaceae bacterium]MCX7640250.1 flavodoxin-dependent (E)-4-hydroxy-3-methylbut-2-enyl-diphosphate synthase [Pyrinomonadaceae bacterium]MDW8305126.1 flavodoxin-dependent (E)-4-hydroxy-3-methylbut-2-enyl-diphosphate synthase [Acidobacteriota bacterium]
MERRKSRPVKVRNIQIGGGAPIVVQSMTKTDTCDVEATIKQIEEMVAAGCEIVRVAVPDKAAAAALKEIRKRTDVPLVADIHFHYKLALMALEAGVDKLRINPGNIGSIERVREVVRAAESQKVPIRIGVNGGSLEKDLLQKYGSATPEAMVESAMRHVKILEDLGFSDIVISLKASDVARTVAAYRLIASKVDYPLHLGVTEAGTPFSGTIKSAIGLGILLHEGIGDTIRVSLAADPVEEVRVAWEILRSLELRKRGITVVACPTCGRLDVDDFVGIVTEIERRLAHVEEPLHLSIMGCAVNGPGEAHESQLGVTFGRQVGMIFKNGVPMRKVSASEIVEEFIKEVEILRQELKDKGS